jgi:hypothetical protein
MAKTPDHEQYNEKEIVRRREAVPKHTLSTPDQHHKPIGKKKASPANHRKRQAAKG